MNRCVHGLVLAVAIVQAGSVAPWAVAAADEAWYAQIPLRSLEIVEGSLPADVPSDLARSWRLGLPIAAMRPYAVLDGPGEAYVDFATEGARSWEVPAVLSRARLAVCAPRERDITGCLFTPNADLKGMTAVRFRMPAAADTPQVREAFLRAKRDHYTALLNRGVPGSAWFRHQTREARQELGEAPPEAAATAPEDEEFVVPGGRRGGNDLSSTYALFSGGRAMSENLQLDRVLRPAAQASEAPDVDVDSIAGISTQEMDWSALVKNLNPNLDPLAAFIPVDQHVIFFPSFDAAVLFADEAARYGLPVLRLIEPRSEDALTRSRYERQLCLPLSALGRLLGPQLIQSVALTGSDPYFRTGTDVAVLFATTNPAALRTLLQAQVTAALQANPSAKPLKGEGKHAAYVGARSDDRSICAYIAAVGNCVVVTNSLQQLDRISSAHRGEVSPIKSLPEYVFFRNRYVLGDQDETALVFLSDATIRRWCGPRWRIASSRRTRDAAVLANLQATFLDQLVRGKAEDGPIHTDLPLAVKGGLRLSPGGVRSEALNSLGFLTPLAELPVRTVTSAEAEAYNRWRDGYERNWRQSFDPIAIRLGVNNDQLSADVTVMPLIAGTEYQQFIAVSRGAVIAPQSGDLHDALVHGALAINMSGPAAQQWNNMAVSVVPGLGVNPFAWLGHAVALYADPDPLWRELAQTPDEQKGQFLSTRQYRLPLALHAEVADPLKLAVFLTAARAFVQQSAPGMVNWEALTYKEKPYVKVSAAEQGKGNFGDFAMYYSAGADGLTITPNESVLQRAMDRHAAARDAKEPESLPACGPWLGSSMGLKVTADAIDLLSTLFERHAQQALQLRAWGSIPILNEWKHRYPDQDPLKLHEAFWHTRLVCPGGGTYTWNEQFQTMESTVFGSPANPNEGPTLSPLLQLFSFGDLGVSFEEQGLRARTRLMRRGTPDN